MECKQRIKGNTWNEDLLSIICNFLNQNDVHSMSLTCKTWNEVANQRLYSQIYITERSRQLNVEPNDPIFNDWPVIHKPTLAANSLGSSVCSLKKLERTLRENSSLTRLIHGLAIQDLAFVLFKLEKWARSFFVNGCNIRSVEMIDVPLKFFEIGFDSLFTFYKSRIIMTLIRNLQMRTFSDLLRLVSFADKFNQDLKLSSLTFYSESTSTISSKELKCSVLKVLRGLKSLKIFSENRSCFPFFSFLSLVFQDSVLNNLETLRFLHSHKSEMTGATDSHPENDDVILAFEKLRILLDARKIRRLDIMVECQHDIPGNHLVALHSSIPPGCLCFGKFFEGLLLFLSRCESLGILRVDRLENSNISDPLLAFQFKLALSRFIQRLATQNHKFQQFSFNTHSSVIPPYTSILLELMSHMNEVNKDLLNSLKQLKIVMLNIPDYIESFLLWKYQNDAPTTNVFNFIESHCQTCKTTYLVIKNFVAANSKVQFTSTLSSKQHSQSFITTCYFVFSSFSITRSWQE